MHTFQFILFSDLILKFQQSLSFLIFLRGASLLLSEVPVYYYCAYKVLRILELQNRILVLAFPFV